MVGYLKKKSTHHLVGSFYCQGSRNFRTVPDFFRCKEMKGLFRKQVEIQEIFILMELKS